MGKENFDAYSVGSFEASNFTRNALMGNREGKNIRAQQLGTPKNAFKQVETFTPKQLKAKEAITGLQHGQEYKNAKNAQDLQDSINFINLSNKKAFQEDMLMRMEPQIWAAIDRKLGEEGKKQVLAAVKAREASVEKTVVADQEQAIVLKQQVEAETAKILAQAPEALLYGSLAVLAVWVINRLPKKFYRLATVTTIASLVLAACITVNAATEVAPSPGLSATKGNESTPLPNAATEVAPSPGLSATKGNESTPSPTRIAIKPAAQTVVATPTPTETTRVNQVDQLLSTYLAGGEIDISTLSPKEFIEFSEKLAEEKNKQRGVNVATYDEGSKNPAYIDNNFDMRPYDGEPNEEETIEMYLPISGFDEKGNLRFTQNGKLVTVPNSSDIAWDAIVTDEKDPRVDWPTGKAYKSLTWQLEYQKNPMIMKPVILTGDKIHKIYIGNHGFVNGLEILIVEETDKNGKPILLRRAIAFPGSIYSLATAGEDTEYMALRQNEDEKGGGFYGHLQKVLESNGGASLSWVGFRENLELMLKKEMGGGSLEAYGGTVPVEETVAVLTNKKTNKTQLMLVPVMSWLAANGKALN